MCMCYKGIVKHSRGVTFLAGEVAVVGASPAVLAGVVASGVASPGWLHWGDVPGRPHWGCHRRCDIPADAAVASLVDAGVAAGVASLADLARAVTVDVAAPAYAGVASLAAAGVASLADFAGSVDEITLQQECIVRDCSVVDGSVSGDSQMGCDDCVSAEIWCQGRLGVCDESGWQCVAYMSCDPDCVDQPVPKDDDGNLF